MLYIGGSLNTALHHFMPDAATDILIGLACAVILRLILYVRSKNAKKYRHNIEYGSARWGNQKDIAPFMDKDPQKNIILTATEGLTMESRPKNPANARNKNVLVAGGSGSGKTRFFILPQIMQLHSSYVVNDPKGTLILECGHLLVRSKYKLKIFNTINFE
jgi:type IV secretion system protein VirD4